MYVKFNDQFLWCPTIRVIEASRAARLAMKSGGPLEVLIGDDDEARRAIMVRMIAAALAGTGVVRHLNGCLIDLDAIEQDADREAERWKSPPESSDEDKADADARSLASRQAEGAASMTVSICLGAVMEIVISHCPEAGTLRRALEEFERNTLRAANDAMSMALSRLGGGEIIEPLTDLDRLVDPRRGAPEVTSQMLAALRSIREALHTLIEISSSL